MLRKHILGFCVWIWACGPHLKTEHTEPPYVPPPNPIVVATGDDVALCAKLGVMGCSDAFPRSTTCVKMFEQYHTDGITVPYDCLNIAHSIPEVRACGDSNTLRFRCK